jgi:hypothetical protein
LSIVSQMSSSTSSLVNVCLAANFSLIVICGASE